MSILQSHQIFAGRYDLIELLGKGGYGEVWKATDQMAHQAVVALKIYAPGPAGLKPFHREYAFVCHSLITLNRKRQVGWLNPKKKKKINYIAEYAIISV